MSIENKIIVNYEKQLNEQIKDDHQNRGHLFEKIVNRIFKDQKLLVFPSYKTDGQKQQIDGAICIKGKVFLLEVKWENHRTLAASKLYSFIGKLNSKIEGTLGIFISYSRLNDNFISSIRDGIRQNCLIIHGEENIMPIIRGKVDLEEYIWYLFLLSSAKGVTTFSVEEYLILNNDISNSQWDRIFKLLKNNDSFSDLKIFLKSINSFDSDITRNVLLIYPQLKKEVLDESLSYLLNTLYKEDKECFIEELLERFDSDEWQQYETSELLGILKKEIISNSDKLRNIVNRLLEYLDENLGNWDEENIPSNVLSSILNSLSRELVFKIARKYLIIYCDTDRRDHYSQKRFSSEVFKKMEEFNGYQEEIEDMVRNYILANKKEEVLFISTNEQYQTLKDRIRRRTNYRLERVINEYRIKIDDMIEDAFCDPFPLPRESK